MTPVPTPYPPRDLDLDCFQFEVGRVDRTSARGVGVSTPERTLTSENRTPESSGDSETGRP